MDIHSPLGAEAVPVSYSNSRAGNGGNVQEDDIFSHKYVGWIYEKEWRVIQIPGNALHPIPGEISSVIIGSKMDDGSIKAIKNIVDHHNSNKENKLDHIKIKHAKMDSVKYKINILAESRTKRLGSISSSGNEETYTRDEE